MYAAENRGKVIYPERFHQAVLFDGLRYGNITPTDVDGMIEYHNKAYVIYEVKRKGKDVPSGQKIALKRMVDDFSKAGKDALCIVCEHDTPAGEDVNVQKCKVREIYWNGFWYNTEKENITAKNKTDSFLKWVDKKQKGA